MVGGHSLIENQEVYLKRSSGEFWGVSQHGIRTLLGLIGNPDANPCQSKESGPQWSVYKSLRPRNSSNSMVFTAICLQHWAAKRPARRLHQRQLRLPGVLDHLQDLHLLAWLLFGPPLPQNEGCPRLPRPPKKRKRGERGPSNQSEPGVPLPWLGVERCRAQKPSHADETATTSGQLASRNHGLRADVQENPTGVDMLTVPGGIQVSDCVVSLSSTKDVILVAK